jgi:2-hydroxy-3-oxopropionate reductase
MGLSLPNTASTQQLMSSCVANGGAGWDHSGIVRALEIAANFQISPTPTV